jgi:NADH-quinone oxidoreductase subunit N
LPVPTDQGTIVLLLPEIVLVVVAAATMVGSSFAPRRAVWYTISLAAILVAAGLLLGQDRSLWESGRLSAEQAGSASGPVLVDFFGHALRWVALLVGLLFVLMAARAAQDALSGEYLAMLTLVFAGLMLASSAADLVLLFLAIELVSIPTYVLLFLGRKGGSSAEATAKYFFLSILASALLLYGFSLLYGVSGTTQLAEMRGRLIASDPVAVGTRGAEGLAVLAVIFIFAGLGFKIAAVPFHFYAPDVYQGTTNTNAGLLAVAPKILGIVALTRILVAVVGPTIPSAWQIALVLSMATMTVGNVCALWQNNLRRLLAYSSIAHAGYMLIGLAVALAAADAPQAACDGLTAMLFYLGVYVAASLGAFSVLVCLSRPDHETSSMSELAGLGRSRPVLAGAMALFMFSLSGIPPLAGFWGKLGLFTSALAMGLVDPARDLLSSGWFVALAVAGAVNAAIAAAYYLRVVGTMYFQTGEQTPRLDAGPGPRLTTLACAVLVVAIGLWPTRFAGLSRSAALSTRVSPSPPAQRMVVRTLTDELRQ